MSAFDCVHEQRTQDIDSITHVRHGLKITAPALNQYFRFLHIQSVKLQKPIMTCK